MSTETILPSGGFHVNGIFSPKALNESNNNPNPSHPPIPGVQTAPVGWLVAAYDTTDGTSSDINSVFAEAIDILAGSQQDGTQAHLVSGIVCLNGLGTKGNEKEDVKKLIIIGMVLQDGTDGHFTFQSRGQVTIVNLTPHNFVRGKYGTPYWPTETEAETARAYIKSEELRRSRVVPIMLKEIDAGSVMLSRVLGDPNEHDPDEVALSKSYKEFLLSVRSIGGDVAPGSLDASYEGIKHNGDARNRESAFMTQLGAYMASVRRNARVRFLQDAGPGDDCIVELMG